MVTKRSGEVVGFDEERIHNAIMHAVRAVKQQVEPEVINKLVTEICAEIDERFIDFYPNVENVQDIVEKHLVNADLYEIAKEYILYRARRQEDREAQKKSRILRRRFWGN